MKRKVERSCMYDLGKGQVGLRGRKGSKRNQGKSKGRKSQED
jgi:hypothetical protein